MRSKTTLGLSLSKAFDAERSMVDALTQTNLELPWCKDVAPGKKVKLKYHYGPRWWVVAEGQWAEYSRTKQVIEGGFNFSWQIRGSTLSFRLTGSFRGRPINEKGSLTVSAYDRCDECDNGKKNNRTALGGPTEGNGRFDTWPKNRDRTRLVITESRGKKHELEIDTKE